MISQVSHVSKDSSLRVIRIHFPHDISKRKLNVEQDMQNSMHGFEATCLIDMWLLYVPFTLLANCVVAAETQDINRNYTQHSNQGCLRYVIYLY